MTDASAVNIRSYDQEIADCERAIRAKESAEIDARDRRAYSLDPSDVMLWMLSIPFCLTFLVACVWAIATNG